MNPLVIGSSGWTDKAARQPLQGVHILNGGVARTLRATVDEQDSTIKKQGGSVLRVPLHASGFRNYSEGAGLGGLIRLSK